MVNVARKVAGNIKKGFSADLKKMRRPVCGNCQGENARTGYVESWDGVCPDCGRRVRRK